MRVPRRYLRLYREEDDLFDRLYDEKREREIEEEIAAMSGEAARKQPIELDVEIFRERIPQRAAAYRKEKEKPDPADGGLFSYGAGV